MPVNRSDVVEAELLEQSAGNDQALDVLLGTACDLLNRWHSAEDLLAALLDGRVQTAREELGETVRERTDVRRNRHLVVVEHDKQVGAGTSGVVQGLERHAAGETPVTDDGNDLAIATGTLRRNRHSGCRADRCTRMADPERVVRALAAFGKWRYPPPFAHRVHLVAPPGQDLVGVALMPDVPDDAIARCVVQIMECDGELDCAETGREVAAGLGDAVDEISAKLPGYAA